MRFIDIAERKELERAAAEGLEKGREEGLLEGIERCLRIKFGPGGLELMPEVRRIRDHQRLREVLAGIEAADSPDDLRRAWSRKRRPRAAKPE